MTRIILTRSASDDIDEIVDHVASTLELDQALKIDERIQTALQRLDVYPERGRLVPELRDDERHAYREVIVAPHRIIYRVEVGDVIVIAVVDHHRDAQRLLVDRASRR